MNRGIIFAALGLLFGGISDYMQSKQNEIEIKETIDRELDRRLKELKLYERR